MPPLAVTALQIPTFFGHLFTVALQAAVLLVKLPHLDRWTAARQRNAQKRDGGWSAGGLLFQHLPEGEQGRDRLHTRLDHPDWPHVAILAGSVRPDELTDPGLPLDDHGPALSP